jgi:L-fuculose-phosphate aldolase
MTAEPSAEPSAGGAGAANSAGSPAGVPVAAPRHDDSLTTENQARAALIDTCRELNARGINQGKAGNASLRWDRGGAAGLLVTPSALPYARMRPDDIVWLSLQTRTQADSQTDSQTGGAPPTVPAVIDSNGRRPSSEWRIHRDIYAARPDAAAVVHAHPPHATALACLASVQAAGIPAFHYMVAMAGGNDIRCAGYATFGTQALSDTALAALAGRRACLMAHHGIVALGASLESALALAEEVESLSRMYHLACQLGVPPVLGDDEMARVLVLFADYRPDQAAAPG